MTAECLGETGMSLKAKLTVVREAGQRGNRDHTQEAGSHSWKMFKCVTGSVHRLDSLLPLLLFQKVIDLS